jgi:hypothetical protein
MAVEIVIRVSPRMFQEDVEALRVWLARQYPATWTEAREAPAHDGLGIVEVLMVGVFTGAGEAVAKAVVDSVHGRIKQLAERYPRGEPRPAAVEARVLPDPAERPDLVVAAVAGAAGAADDPWPAARPGLAGHDPA